MSNISTSNVNALLRNGYALQRFAEACENELSFSPLSLDVDYELTRCLQRVDDSGDHSDAAIDRLDDAIGAAYEECFAAIDRDRTDHLAVLFEEAFASDYEHDPDYDPEADWAEFCNEVLGDEPFIIEDVDYDEPADELSFLEKLDEDYEAYMANGGKMPADEPDVPDPDAYLEDLCAEALIPEFDSPDWDESHEQFIEDDRIYRERCENAQCFSAGTTAWADEAFTIEDLPLEHVVADFDLVEQGRHVRLELPRKCIYTFLEHYERCFGLVTVSF